LNVTTTSGRNAPPAADQAVEKVVLEHAEHEQRADRERTLEGEKPGRRHAAAETRCEQLPADVLQPELGRQAQDPVRERLLHGDDGALAQLGPIGKKRLAP